MLSDNFRYLGDKGTDDYKRRHRRIQRLVEGLKRGHRHYHSDQLRDELLARKAEAWEQYRRKKVGVTSDGDFTRACNKESPSATCPTSRMKT